LVEHISGESAQVVNDDVANGVVPILAEAQHFLELVALSRFGRLAFFAEKTHYMPASLLAMSATLLLLQIEALVFNLLSR
jgi:hypothetical protein